QEPEFLMRRTAAFGGNGGNPFDDARANPRRLAISRLNVGVTFNPANHSQYVIGRLQAQWGDVLGPLHGGGPLDVPTAPAQFDADETIGRILIFHMDYTWVRNEAPPHWVAGLQVHTNKRVYHFGNTEGRSNACTTSSGGTLIGFLGRSGSYVDALGCIF